MMTAPDHDDAIVDYVLGWMSADERTKFEKRLKSDVTLNASVETMRTSLAPLDANSAPVTPSPEVWERIEARIENRNADLRRPTRLLGPSLAGGAILAGLALLAIFHAPKIVSEADLQPSAAAAPTATVKIDSHKDLTLVDEGLPVLATDKSLEVWYIPPSGVPEAMGTLPREKPYRVHLDELPQSGTIAISVEPLGGAPGNAPTGPVIVTGALKTL